MSLTEHFWMDAAALALALILDIALGEPKTILHPVALIGKIITWLQYIAPKTSRIAQFSYGLGMALLLPATVAFVGYSIVVITREFNSILYIVVVGFLLKSCFAVRDLGQAAWIVGKSLEEDEMEKARADLSALVSRDTVDLTPNLVASAAVESVAENTTDSFVAPWLFFALFGLPGALAYRTVNTLDSMIGYRGKYEYLGKVSARLDDVLNFVPARLSAVLITIAGMVRGHSIRGALRVMVRDGGNTESPNAGFTMAAMAGALNVTLEKTGHYTLGSDLRQPVAADIEESVRIMQLVAAMICGLSLAILVVRHAV